MINDYGITLEATASAGRLTKELEKIFKDLHPESDNSFIAPLVEMVRKLFEGEDKRYNAIDMAYHDVGHTFQTAICLARMLAGRSEVHGLLPMGPDDFRRGLAAMLFHDTGYLKVRDDKVGTGAKYTFIHEQRSAELAAHQLGRLGWPERELTAIRQFILCTGPSSRPDRVFFANPVDAELGAMVCTADFLGQMSDPMYLKKLPALFREFEEAYDFRGLAPNERPFRSLEDLLIKTPSFWRDFVLPKLHTECRAVYRYLAVPPGSEDNPYLKAVEAHISELAPGGRGGIAA